MPTLRGNSTHRADVVHIAIRALPVDHWHIGTYHEAYGEALLRAGRADEARAELAEAVRILTKRLGPEHPRTQEARASFESDSD